VNSATVAGWNAMSNRGGRSTKEAVEMEIEVLMKMETETETQT